MARFLLRLVCRWRHRIYLQHDERGIDAQPDALARFGDDQRQRTLRDSITTPPSSTSHGAGLTEAWRGLQHRSGRAADRGLRIAVRAGNQTTSLVTARARSSTQPTRRTGRSPVTRSGPERCRRRAVHPIRAVVRCSRSAGTIAGNISWQRPSEDHPMCRCTALTRRQRPRQRGRRVPQRAPLRRVQSPVAMTH